MKVLVILQWVVCHGNGSWKKNHCWALHDSVSLRTVEGWHIQGERKKKSSELSVFYSLIHHMHCMNCNHIWWNAVTKACLGKWSSHRGLSASQNRYQHAWGEGPCFRPTNLATKLARQDKDMGSRCCSLPFHLYSLPSTDPCRLLQLYIQSHPPTQSTCFHFNIEWNQVLKPQKLPVALWSVWTGMPNYITYNSGRDQKTAQNITCLLSLLKLSWDHNRTVSHIRMWKRFPYFQLLAGPYKTRVQALLWR